uniref:Uncharacterized protein n=1 Tax=Chromera velia CCMP2878 TaxID=1169474 RepID=A0A0G4HMK3_9ALVE|eukprot:Cvel_29306.t1-p1 / transcript=Cvel_29306.t1 / gene=Cvel_29306 / organism=Chromera_velia_CCMP2878 / gene_product=hypothetical protein / transcript_product=hypothetical protein / location=Cvel_scaffold3986:2736-7803(+) / protein_length=524 / sequence_SO=supercontig / SO=protein_coding / is_pseudo=false
MFIFVFLLLLGNPFSPSPSGPFSHAFVGPFASPSALWSQRGRRERSRILKFASPSLESEGGETQTLQLVFDGPKKEKETETAKAAPMELVVVESSSTAGVSKGRKKELSYDEVEKLAGRMGPGPIYDNFMPLPEQIRQAIVIINDWKLKNENNPKAQNLCAVLEQGRPPDTEDLNPQDPDTLRIAIDRQTARYNSGQALNEKTFDWVQVVQEYCRVADDKELLEFNQVVEALNFLSKATVKSLMTPEEVEQMEAEQQKNIEKYVAGIREFEKKKKDAGEPLGGQTYERNPNSGITKVYNREMEKNTTQEQQQQQTQTQGVQQTGVGKLQLSVTKGGEGQKVKKSKTVPERLSSFLMGRQVEAALSFAAVLCAIDCTVLPLVTSLSFVTDFLPSRLFGVAGAGHLDPHFLHSLGHKLSLYFVVPLSLTTAIANGLRLKSALFAAWGLGATSLVFLAHAPAGGLLGFAAETMAWLHQYHGAMSLAGCAALLSCNWAARKRADKCKKCCGACKGHPSDASVTKAVAS